MNENAPAKEEMMIVNMWIVLIYIINSQSEAKELVPDGPLLIEAGLATYEMRSVVRKWDRTRLEIS